MPVYDFPNYEKRFEQIVFTAEEFGGKEGLYNAVAQQLRLLMDSGYIAVVRLDEVDIVVIEFEHNERLNPWGGATPVWLMEDEEFRAFNIDDEDCMQCEEVLCRE